MTKANGAQLFLLVASKWLASGTDDDDGWGFRELLKGLIYVVSLMDVQYQLEQLQTIILLVTIG